MASQQETLDLILQPEDNRRLANLCGQMDSNIRQIERRLGIEINNRGNVFKLKGARTAVNGACEVLKDLYDASGRENITPELVQLHLQNHGVESALHKLDREDRVVKSRRGLIRVRGDHQSELQYLITRN